MSSPQLLTPEFSALLQDANPVWNLEKCLIRPFRENDAHALAVEANCSKIAKYMRNIFPYPYTIDNAREFIALSTAKPLLSNFALCRLEDDRLIGCIGVTYNEDIYYRTMEVGYWIGEDHWNQGIGTEAVSAFSEWIFEKFQHILRLEAQVFEGNEASGRVLEKAGFVLECRRRKAVEKDGVVLDMLIYCKLRTIK
ncbi:hypothetical protein AJ78_00423 [Emergomyces pasteurianus Ep9510]|uniref:N-acetyltransferase domain-containing protein n=1 Tax=Emergomyces pasteurianus Ep9510 TaxID=1447872 RepID=A0A1J9PTG8_9EURO|nr:hypothetical protein AJ78_00423 [Emergomyces pasteurianus Ep9510]